MKLHSLIVPAAGTALALLAPAAFAGVVVGVGIPVAPVRVYAPPPAVVVTAPPVVAVAAPVAVVPAPVVVPRAYVAPVYPAVTVRAGYWPRGVVVVR
ncbi:hypothetical protein [Burkholderia perseverans]|uniref:hypothetical protein n=1 Tax=Burkholderia perseverans TaxID=2615214 RepID=UPI001FF061F5|nr:hypothetical protein [Burkholderia perseverans]